MKILKNKEIINSNIKEYFENIHLISKNIDYETVSKISIFLKTIIKKNSNIFVAGNGGSAAVANHLLCDFNKGTKILSKNKFKLVEALRFLI